MVQVVNDIEGMGGVFHKGGKGLNNGLQDDVQVLGNVFSGTAAS